MDPRGGAVLTSLVMLMLVFNACSDSSVLNQKQEQKQQISKIDGKPIMKIDAADLYKTDRFEKYIKKVAAKDGHTIMRVLKEKAGSLKKNQTASIAVKDLEKYANQELTGSKSGTPTSTNVSQLANVGSELHVKDANGKVEKFMMTLHPWAPDPASESSKQVVQRMVSSANNNAGGDTYLALDPDFFYIHDNASGEENYLVTFAAVSLSDSTQKSMVTLTRKANGKVVFHFNQPVSASGHVRSSVNSKGGGQPNLVFAEATPEVQPNFIAPNPGGGGGGTGGGGGNSGCQEVDNRGGSTGLTSTGEKDFFKLYHVHLWADGEGGHGAELQMFVKNDDNYNDNCFPGEYKYRFDSVWRGGGENTRVVGADGNIWTLPDINNEGRDYSLLNLFVLSGTTGYTLDGFPLIDLTDNPGPWRLVLVDDDKDYKDFATNHVQDDPFYKDVQTYDMSSGQWSEVHTGFTTNEKKNGNSDDPIQESGVRLITKQNVENRSHFIADLGDGVVAKKNYSGRGLYFEYVFGIRRY